MLETRNFAPSKECAQFVRRFYVTEANLPDGTALEDSILAETGFVRILLEGDWSVQTASGAWERAGRIALFGGNSRALPVRLSGRVRFASFSVRPSAWRNIFKERAFHYVDKVVPLQQDWGADADSLLEQVLEARNDSEIVAAMERAILFRQARIGRKRLDQDIARLEFLARTNSTLKMEDAAQDLDMSVRQMERRCLDTFGLSPKLVFQRSRFLDMTETMRNMSKPGEELLARLRYFDESHLNREFRRFVGTTPGRFGKASTPLFDASLQLRFKGKSID